MLVRVASKDEIPMGKGKEFEVNNKRVVIFNVDGKYYATEAYCRHQDGPLADGVLKGEIIECPWHFWHYNVKTGELLDYLKDVRLDTYKVEVKGDELYIDI